MSKVKTWIKEHSGFTTMLIGIIGLAVLFVTYQPSEVDSPEPIPEPSVIIVESTSGGQVEPPIGLTPMEPLILPKPSVTQEPEPEPEPRYGFTEDEMILMARLLSGDKNVDGDGEYDIDFGKDDRYDQISLVLCVVMNRVRSDQFPNTVAEVILANNGTVWQFSPVKKWRGEPNVSDIALLRVREWCEAYDRYDMGVQSVPENHLYFTGDGKENHSR